MVITAELFQIIFCLDLSRNYIIDSFFELTVTEVVLYIIFVFELSIIVQYI